LTNIPAIATIVCAAPNCLLKRHPGLSGYLAGPQLRRATFRNGSLPSRATLKKEETVKSSLAG
jgi:hypothetical protein